MSKQKKITPSYSYRERIDYIATALAYCWLIWISKVRHAIQNGVFYIIRLFVFIFFSQNYLDKFYKKHMDALEAQEILFGDLEHGHDISIAKRMVYQTFGGYMAFPLVVVASIICSFIGWDLVIFWNDRMIYFGILFTVVVLITIGLCILTKIFEDPRDYISYFEEFKKNNEEWHKRWKRYTILLFVGGILSAALSIGFIFLCVIIVRNIHGPFN